jgi:hypothetical protein
VQEAETEQQAEFHEKGDHERAAAHELSFSAADRVSPLPAQASSLSSSTSTNTPAPSRNSNQFEKTQSVAKTIYAKLKEMENTQRKQRRMLKESSENILLSLLKSRRKSARNSPAYRNAEASIVNEMSKVNAHMSNNQDETASIRGLSTPNITGVNDNATSSLSSHRQRVSFSLQSSDKKKDDPFNFKSDKSINDSNEPSSHANNQLSDDNNVEPSHSWKSRPFDAGLSDSNGDREAVFKNPVTIQMGFMGTESTIQNEHEREPEHEEGIEHAAAGNNENENTEAESNGGDHKINFIFSPFKRRGHTENEDEDNADVDNDDLGSDTSKNVQHPVFTFSPIGTSVINAPSVVDHDHKQNQSGTSFNLSGTNLSFSGALDTDMKVHLQSKNDDSDYADETTQIKQVDYVSNQADNIFSGEGDSSFKQQKKKNVDGSNNKKNTTISNDEDDNKDGAIAASIFDSAVTSANLFAPINGDDSSSTNTNNATEDAKKARR